jgi:hypothetical protein
MGTLIINNIPKRGGYPIIISALNREYERFLMELQLKPRGIKLLTVGWARCESELDVPRKCYAHYYKIALTAEGDLTFCNMCRGMNNFYLGSINENTLREAWNSDATLKLESWIRPNNCGLFCKGMLINLTVESAMEPGADMSPNFF